MRFHKMLVRFGLRKKGYWQKRKYNLYYNKTVQIIDKYFKNCNSVIDVGSNDTRILEEIKNIEKKVAIDLQKLPDIPGVKTIKVDFMEYNPNEYFDLVLCLQVLEHLEDPKPFVQKLFKTGSNIIISVPYRWPESRSKYHLQDPIDEEKLKSWTLKEPHELHVIREYNGIERLIAIYTENN